VTLNSPRRHLTPPAQQPAPPATQTPHKKKCKKAQETQALGRVGQEEVQEKEEALSR
jgi:hypothetical protein